MNRFRILRIVIILLTHSLDGIHAPISIGHVVPTVSYGGRTVVLVAFDANYTISNFITNLRQFAAAFNCPYRHQFVTFYFGDFATRIDCDYRMSMIECVDQRIVANNTIMLNTYEVCSAFKNKCKTAILSHHYIMTLLTIFCKWTNEILH